PGASGSLVADAGGVVFDAGALGFAAFVLFGSAFKFGTVTAPLSMTEPPFAPASAPPKSEPASDVREAVEFALKLFFKAEDEEDAEPLPALIEAASPSGERNAKFCRRSAPPPR